MTEQVAALFRRAPVIPVLTIGGGVDAVALGRALADGGLVTIEVTLRTTEALAAIRRMRAALNQAVVGAGTVTTPAEFADAVRAGAQFIVSPGITPELVEAARAHPDVPYVPGIATASEAMQAKAAGYRHMKFFPAEAMGGTATLKAMAGPFPDLKFCPTGGITYENAPRYLSLPSVVAVGGSWVAPAGAVVQEDWGRIGGLARAAAKLRG